MVNVYEHDHHNYMYSNIAFNKVKLTARKLATSLSMASFGSGGSGGGTSTGAATYEHNKEVYSVRFENITSLHGTK